MAPEDIIAGVMVISLILYTLTGGADFGGGIWDLLASGKRAEAQRELIARSIAPIWEANHVWLILVIVLMFVAFPLGFGSVSIALHIPFTLLLFGIIFRGAAFTFRTYDQHTLPVQRRWSRLFAVSSLVAPFILGVCLGAVGSGKIRLDPATNRVHADFFSSWLGLFPVCLGFLTLVLCAYIAAVYLTLETDDPALREDFRLRALVSGGSLGGVAAICLFVSDTTVPVLWEGLTQRWWSIPFHALTGVVALTALMGPYGRRYGLARICAALQVTLIILGWAFTQYPHLIPPDMTLQGTAAPENVLRLLIWILAAGAVVLFPSLWYLYRVFKQGGAQKE